MTVNEDEQKGGPEALRQSVDGDAHQDDLVAAEDGDEMVDQLKRMVAELESLEQLLSDTDPVVQLTAFREWASSDSRLAKLKCLVADSQDEFDIFDVLRIHHLELVHSFFLAWLLNPQQNYGIGSYFLHNFLSHAVEAAQEQGIETLPASRIHTIDWSETEVLREWRNIDILILNRKAGFVCAVENKVWSEEGFDDDGVSQLTRYRETLATEFPDYKVVLVFLSPSGVPSKSETEENRWVAVNYRTIQQLIVQTMQHGSAGASPEVQWFLKQYETTLRRNIVPDNSEIGELARQIYIEHREAIELIYRHKPNYSAEIKQVLKEAIVQQDGWLLDAAVGAYVRFRPPDWDRFEHLKTGIGWGGASPTLLLFEFYCPADPLGAAGPALVLGPGTDAAIRRKLFEFARQKPSVFKPTATSLGDGYTHLDEYRRNLLEESDLSAKWADGTTRDKLARWVKSYAENDFPAIHNAVVECLEEYGAEMLKSDG